MIAPFWAAIASCRSGHETSSVRSEPVVPTVRVRHALQWIIAFTRGIRGALGRKFKVQQTHIKKHPEQILLQVQDKQVALMTSKTEEVIEAVYILIEG